MADSLHNPLAEESCASSNSDDWGLDKEIERLERRGWKRWAKLSAMILIFVAIAILVAFLGAWYRGEALQFLPICIEPTVQSQQLDKQAGNTLLLETAGERRRVIVQRPDRTGWVLVSRDDFTAANPALSPDGAWVAYLSTQNAPEVEIVPLEQSGRVTYTSAGLRGFCQREGLAKMSICPWTPVAWSMDSTRLAFFGCTTEPPTSQAFVIDLSASGLTLQTSIITDTEATGADPRQISWIGSDQVLVTFPPTANAETETVTTIPVPPANE